MGNPGGHGNSEEEKRHMASAYSLLMAQAIEAYPKLTAREAYTRFMQCMSKADLPSGETRRGPIVVEDSGYE